MSDIEIGGVSLDSLTDYQLEQTRNAIEYILLKRSEVRIREGSHTELLKPGIKKEIHYNTSIRLPHSPNCPQLRTPEKACTCYK